MRKFRQRQSRFLYLILGFTFLWDRHISKSRRICVEELEKKYATTIFSKITKYFYSSNKGFHQYNISILYKLINLIEIVFLTYYKKRIINTFLFLWRRIEFFFASFTLRQLFSFNWEILLLFLLSNAC